MMVERAATVRRAALERAGAERGSWVGDWFGDGELLFPLSFSLDDTINLFLSTTLCMTSRRVRKGPYGTWRDEEERLSETMSLSPNTGAAARW